MSEVFSADVVKAAFIRSDGECECTKSNHKHSGRCNNLMIYSMRGMDLPGGWETDRVNSDSPPVAVNCRIICMDCFKADK
ncbi:MAG: hypothetical protein PHY77_07615 [Desulfotomaculaceae bacterium]|nr:hypothetical protein [Desulfotomaculaceae bacterium]